MRTIKFLLFSIPCFFLMLDYTHLSAQTSAQPWSAGITLGKAEYNGDMGNGIFNVTQPFQGQIGLKASRYLNSSLDLSLNGSYGRFGHWETMSSNFLSDMLSVDLAINYKFNNGYILPENARVAPFIFAGVGMANLRAVDDRIIAGTDFKAPFGAGVDVRLTDRVSAFYQFTWAPTSRDNLERQNGGHSDIIGLQQIGIKFNFGNKVKDFDKDGISDKNDECPNLAGLEKFKGCPDTDGDGIADKDDNCPNVSGTLQHGGCPEISSSTLQVFARAIEGINFETSKAVIKTDSYPILNEVVAIMKENPSYKLNIDGHTDSSGDAEMNMNLSRERANAVKTYLMNNGIESSRMTASGFGETMPIADNNTQEGKTKNRRVEFKVSY